jgi:sulfide dehydrogenase cytochrome subunit
MVPVACRRQGQVVALIFNHNVSRGKTMSSPFRQFRFLAVVLAALFSVTAEAAPDAQARQLAATCSACHGTNGKSVGGTPVLAGLNRAHFIKQMKDFKSGARPATVMQRHAAGYSDAEIEKMADYFAAQKR